MNALILTAAVVVAAVAAAVGLGSAAGAGRELARLTFGQDDL